MKKVVLKIVKNSTEKILTFHNAIILIKSIFSDNKYDYYYNIFFKKGLYKDKSNILTFQINVCRLQMLYFDRIDFSKGVGVN